MCHAFAPVEMVRVLSLTVLNVLYMEIVYSENPRKTDGATESHLSPR